MQMSTVLRPPKQAMELVSTTEGGWNEYAVV